MKNPTRRERKAAKNAIKPVEQVQESAPDEQTLEQQASKSPHVVDIQQAMATSLSGGIDSLPAPAAPVELPVDIVEAKPKGKRYAPVSTIANPNAVLVWVHDQYHKPGSLTHDKFAIIIACRGKTIKDVEEAFVAANKPRMKARNQLRWEIEHNRVKLGLPEEDAAK